MVNHDRRRFIRVPSENVIAYSILKKDGTIDMAHSGYVHTKNISQGGILFTAFEKMPVSAQIKMKLRIETLQSKNECIEMIGEVVRNKKLPVGNKWDIAVQINYIEEAKKDVFLDWIEKKIGY